MAVKSRRQFVGLVGATAALVSSSRASEAQAPARGRDDQDDTRKRLGAALRELNQAARLGVTAEDLDRTEAYATGALLEAAARLRPLVLPEGLDLPVVFRAGRRG